MSQNREQAQEYQEPWSSLPSEPVPALGMVVSRWRRLSVEQQATVIGVMEYLIAGGDRVMFGEAVRGYLDDQDKRG